jgi:predicted peptidase
MGISVFAVMIPISLLVQYKSTIHSGVIRTLGAAVLALFCGIGSIAAGHTSESVDGFIAGTYVAVNGTSLPYRLFVPEATRGRPLPLIVFLHGVAGIGTDNRRQITDGNWMGSHRWTVPTAQALHPAFVLAPQLPPGTAWSAPESPNPSLHAALVLELIEELSKSYAIDADRIYAVGQSLGGQGVWDLIGKRPERFAAAIPLCGSGNPSLMAGASRVAVWAFHGARDTVMPVTGSREMVSALRAAGGRVRYTEYPNIGHDVWLTAFNDPNLTNWLFAQARVRHSRFTQ